MMYPAISQRSNAATHHSCTPWRLCLEQDCKNLDSPPQSMGSVQRATPLAALLLPPHFSRTGRHPETRA
jgi:hypothetical protein